MRPCRDCGELIEFRHINYVCTPIHLSGGYGCGRGRWASGDAKTTEPSSSGVCYRTCCPRCREDVFFIRHNGGCVWVDPPLGWPWPKHACFDAGSEPRWLAVHRKQKAGQQAAIGYDQRETTQDAREAEEEIGVVPVMVDESQPSAELVAMYAFLDRAMVKVYAVMNNRAERVAYFPFNKEAEARLYAARWTKETGTEHYVHQVKGLK